MKKKHYIRNVLVATAFALTLGSTHSFASGNSEYIVKKGDCLSRIASNTGVSVATIKSLNHLTSDTIFIGQHLTLSAPAPAKPKTPTVAPKPAVVQKPTVAPAVTTPSVTSTTYVVQSGDSLWIIANKYHTTPTALQTLNNLKTATIYVGQRLMVPSTPVLTAPPTPKSPTVVIPPSKSVNREVLGYTVQYGSTDTASYDSLKNHVKDITSIATATFDVDGSGNLTGIVPTNQVQVANQNQVQSTVMVGNGYSQSVAHSLLSNPTNRKQLITNLVNIVESNGYKGVNIDIENVPASDRSNYTSLMKEVSSAFKPIGYSVSVSLPAKTRDSAVDSWTYAFDYQSIALYVDSALIMTYDEHYQGGTAGSIASIGWDKSVLSYTETAIPKSKILLGIATYGYDWASGVPTQAYGYVQAQNIAQQYHATITLDPISKSPYFQYTDSNKRVHTVWFENPQSIAYKLDLVNAEGIRGIGIWRLGLEDDALWKLIESKF